MAWGEETGFNERLTGAGDQVQASDWDAWEIPVLKYHSLGSMDHKDVYSLAAQPGV